ncbi:Baculoviral inhibition of apoptosis protein repeat protein [Ascosphaera apis ARSEF 7405]|uniref:Baculoviral inhibition of apoptosis protein repeat protein n=1 Tax=Ascosphaera apis ARSEF 7405 TaxID=392613 RepID=A0A167X936_9EURO|nr:Baculoviral inhibition of apoptosis protein repeat protein [Ascosphaera apis ARSEF 7405]
MEIFSNRLATFETSHPSKRRSSGASVDFDTAWPHARPTPEELADAGFYHAPTALSPDNTACFLCERALDGWEEEDDPITEHLRLSQGCGWAIMMDIARRSSDPGSIEDPTSARVTEARRATFRGWPHDGKRGWTCKSDKMVEAGWYYCPMEESEDFVSCPYCKLSLDGWEPKDDPFDEHYRRSDDCSFFQYAVKKPARGGRTKKTRSTKTSSSTTTNSAPPIPPASDVEATADEDKPSSTTGKKSKTTRKGTKTAKSKISRSKKTPAPEPETETVPEPEYPELQQYEPPANFPSKKRPSDAMEEDLPVLESITSKSRDSPSTRSAKRAKKADQDRRMMYLDRVEIESYEDTKAHTRDEFRGKSQIPAQQQLAGAGRSDDGAQTKIEPKRQSGKRGVVDVVSEPQRTESPPRDNSDVDAALQADVDRLAQSLSQENLSDMSGHEGEEQETTNAPTTTLSYDRMNVRESNSDNHVSPRAVRGSAGRGAERSQNPRSYDTHTQWSKQSDISTMPSEVQNSTEAHEVVEGQADDYSMVDADDGADGDRHEQAHDAAEEQPSEHEVDMDRLSLERPPEESSPRHSDERSLREMAEIVMSNSFNDSVRERDVPESEHGQESAEETSERDAEDEERPLPPPPQQQQQQEEEEEEREEEQDEDQHNEDLLPSHARPSTREVNDNNDDAERNSVESTDVGNGGEPSPQAVRPSPQDSAARPHHESNGVQQSPEKSKMHLLRANAKVPGQASDIENQPPSGKSPSEARQRQEAQTPEQSRIIQTTVLPTRTPTDTNAHTSTTTTVRLKTSRPWTEVDIDEALLPKSDEDEDDLLEFLDAKGELTAEEKDMTVEEWIKYTARKAEERLKGECERLIGVFESEGGRAMRTLEGIESND